MPHVIFAKTNMYRSPKYRIQTAILKDEADGHLYVEKRALTKDAIPHIKTISDNYEKVKDLYANVIVIPPRSIDVENGVVRFLYVREDNSSIESSVMARSDKPEQVVAKRDTVKYGKSGIFAFNNSADTHFYMTDAFRDFFPGCEPKEGVPAVRPCNIDGISQNFIEHAGQLHLIDYEWVVDFPVPVGYLLFRDLLYRGELEAVKTYEANQNKEEKDSIYFDVYKNLELYSRMDDCFQELVHGKNRKYMYALAYEKENHDVMPMIDAQRGIIAAQQTEIERLQNKLSEIKRGLKNPLYGATMAIKYLGKHI